MEKNEIRAFKITGDAISELLWELLNKTGEKFLDLPEDEENIYHMHWDKEKDELTFYALEFEHPHPVDFEAIDRHIDEHIGITADSLYCKQRYRIFSADDVGADTDKN